MLVKFGIFFILWVLVLSFFVEDFVSSLVIALFISLSLAFISLAANRERSSKMKKLIAKQNERLREEGIHRDVDLRFYNPLNKTFYRYIVDIANKEILICKNIKSLKFIIIPFSDIIGSEIITDSEVVGSAGRALTGAIIAGTAGAVIGAAAKKKQISSYKVIIYLGTIDRPSITLTLINSKTEVSMNETSDYQRAVKFSHDVNASIKAIVDAKAAFRRQSAPHSANSNASIKEKLTTLKELKESGILTEEEYNQKRQQVLDMLTE